MPCALCKAAKEKLKKNVMCPKCPEYGDLKINPELSIGGKEDEKEEVRED